MLSFVRGEEGLVGASALVWTVMLGLGPLRSVSSDAIAALIEAGSVGLPPGVALSRASSVGRILSIAE